MNDEPGSPYLERQRQEGERALDEYRRGVAERVKAFVRPKPEAPAEPAEPLWERQRREREAEKAARQAAFERALTERGRAWAERERYWDDLISRAAAVVNEAGGAVVAALHAGDVPAAVEAEGRVLAAKSVVERLREMKQSDRGNYTTLIPPGVPRY